MLSLLQMINGEIVTARHFAEIERKARTEIQTLEKEQLSNWVHTVTSGIGVVGCLCLSPAAPIIAAVGGVATIGAVLYGHGQFFGSKGIQLSRAKSIAQAMADATEQQWEALYASCDDRDLFVNAFEAGLLEIAKGHPRHGDVFRKAAAYIHAANPDSIEGFAGRLPTALIAPVEKKVRSTLPVTDDEITHICIVSAERITQSADRKWAAKVIGDASALRDAGNRQGATNKLIYNSRLTEREFAKEGITKARLKLIKEWSASGAPPTIAPSKLLALPPAMPIAEVVEMPIVQTIAAAAPTFSSFQRPIAPVEELDYEIVEDYEEDEDEDEEPIAEVEVIPAAVKPVFSQSGKVRQNTGLATAKELIQALTKEAYRSTALIGGERSGKTYLAAVLSQRLKVERQTKITYINLFDANGDSANDWGHADHVITAHLNDDRCDVEAVLRKVFVQLRRFQKEVNTHLYFDEWVAFTSKSNAWEKKAAEDIRRANAMSGQGEFLEPEGVGTSAVELMNLMSAVASDLSNIGKKQLKAMWLISPALRAGDIFEQGKVMKSLAPAIVIVPPGNTIEWTHPTGIIQEIGFDLARYQVSEVNLAIPKSHNIPKGMDCDRAVFIGGQWYSLDGLNDEKPELDTPIQQTIELDDVWDDSDADDAVIETAEAPDITSIKTRIARVMSMPGLSDDDKLDLIQTLSQHDRLN